MTIIYSFTSRNNVMSHLPQEVIINCVNRGDRRYIRFFHSVHGKK